MTEVDTPSTPGGRILYLGAHYEPAMGGAEITDQMLLEAWVAQGGAAGAMFLGAPGGKASLRGVDLLPVSALEAMGAQARAWKPDLIYSQIGTHRLGLQLARELGIRVLTCLHDPRPLCSATVPLVTCSRLCAVCPHFWPQASQALHGREVLRQFDHIFTPSRFMAEIVRDLAGRDDAEVLYPAVHPVRSAGGLGSAISMATCDVNKGTDLFLKIAERMPDREFILAGRGNARRCGYDPRRHPNVRVTGVLAQDAFYGQSWLVLMPSRWAEPFGRMAPEAQSAGVLFMGSDVAGIPEAAGDAWIPVKDYLDPDAWVRHIRALEADPGLQDDLRARGLHAWRRFEASSQTRQFCARARELLALPGAATDAPVVPERAALPPFIVGRAARALFYASLGASLLGGLLKALGFHSAFLFVPYGFLCAAFALLWGFHAGPLLKLGTRSGYHSGRDLAIVSLVALAAVPLLAARAPWVVLGILMLLGLAAVAHRNRAVKERTRM